MNKARYKYFSICGIDSRGILVDNMLQSSDENIYAAGDVGIERNAKKGYGITYIWPNAMAQ